MLESGIITLIFKKFTLIKLLIGLVLFCSSPTFATVKTIPYIVGGSDTEQEYPWMVALYDGGDFICGGVLISSDWIATAAHCVYRKDDRDGNATARSAFNYKVVIGQSGYYPSTSNAQKAGVTVSSISEVIIQPDYNPVTIDDDIALLKLDTSYYQPGPALASAARFARIEKDDLLTVIGYGYTSSDAGSDDIPDTLQKAQLPLVATNQCYWEDNLTDNMFCAGYESANINIDSCGGDSGGPVFASINGELTLVGLVSWGAEDCADVPGVYTKISNLRGWILDNIDGFQVISEGTARYDRDTQSMTPGLLSVYHYGSNSNSDDQLTIASLTFDDPLNAMDTFNIKDACSDTTLYSTDQSCAIDFDLWGAIGDDALFDATLSVTPSVSAGEQTYKLKFATEVVTEVVPKDKSNGGSLSGISLLLLLLLSFWRMYFNSKGGKVARACSVI